MSRSGPGAPLAGPSPRRLAFSDVRLADPQQ